MLYDHRNRPGKMPQAPVTSIEIQGKTLRVSPANRRYGENVNPFGERSTWPNKKTLRVSSMGMTFQTIIIFRRNLADFMFSGILDEINPKGLDPLYLNSGVLRKDP
jgi:hypothetical protein